MDPQSTEDDAGEFAALGSFDLIAAFLHAKYGEQTLREAFSLVDCYREHLEQAAEILDAKGLSHVADIMFDIAAQSRSEIEACPYAPGSTNWSAWRTNWITRRRIATGEVEASLRARKSRKH
jgi:hypothetical protein